MNNMTKHCLLATIVLFLLCSTEGVEKCAEPCLIYSASSQINGIELSTYRVVNLVSSLRGAVAVDVHVKEKTIYWSDVQQHFIKRMKLQSSGNVEDIITDDLGDVHGLAVEWASNLIYWTDFSKGRVGVASLDGSRKKLLFVEDVGKPRGVALYPKKGLLFWTDWGSPPKIERASLAGLNRTVLVDLSSSNHNWPNAIFVDYTEDRIYWIDAWIDAIDSTDLNGNNRRQITNPIRPSHNMHPFDFTVYDDVLYWSDWNTYSIEKLNWTTGAYLGRFDIVTYAPEFVFGVALLHQSRQPASAGNQLCKGNNGSCSHLCLLTPDGYQCVCPDGFTLESDEKTCQAGTGQFLLFADGKKGRVMKASSNNARLLTSVPLSSSIISRPVALGYDFVEDRVYWTDITLHTISRSFLNGSMQEIIFHQNVQTPDGLAVDPVGRNLYWTDTGTNKLEVSKLDGSYRKALITSYLDEPRDIVLDVAKGIMYWTDWGSFPMIEKATMSGKQRSVVVNSGLRWPNGLTLDKQKNRLYWVDGRYNKLEYLDLITNNRVMLINSPIILPHPFGLTLLGDYLYWTDWQLDSVYRANKESGGHVTPFITGLGQPMDIHGYNLSERETLDHPCSSSNAGCSHLCLLMPGGYACSCPDHLDPGEVCLTSRAALTSTSPRPSLPSSSSSSSSLAVLVLASTSLSPSMSPSVSSSVSPSVSLSLSLSVPTLVSSLMSSSLSPSVSSSVSLSLSSTMSTTVSSLVSSSLSPSVSPSVSPRVPTSMLSLVSSSVSPSVSLSVSSSLSSSVSSLVCLSVSSSVPPSMSSSVPPSMSSSVSPLLSSSVSSSVSPSVLTSVPLSVSLSVSPSVLLSVTPPVSPPLSTLLSSSLSTSVSASVTLSLLPSVLASSSPSISALLSSSMTPPSSSSASALVSTSVLPSVSTPLSVLVSASQSTTAAILPSSEPTTKSSFMSCRPGTCRNGGTCFIPEFVCHCKSHFVGHDCSVHVGSNTVVMVISLPSKRLWNEFQFKRVVAKACTKFFCSNGTCTSKSNSGRRKGSEDAAYCTPSDVIIIGTSFAAENSLKIEFAVLHPSVKGQPPQVANPDEVVEMIKENKEIIEKELGGTIQSVTRKGQEPTMTGGNAKKKKEPSVAPSVVAGVTTTVSIVVIGFIVYLFWRRKVNRAPNDRRDSAAEFHNNFENPVFNGEPVYEPVYISEAANTAAGPIPRVGDNDGLQELAFQDDRNAIHIDQRGNRYDYKNENFHPQQYASLQGTSHCYADLFRPPPQGQGMVQAVENSHYDVPRGASNA